MKKKSFVMVLALVLVFAVAVGGVVAWLTATTGPVKNTFTVGDINIELKETGANDAGEKSYQVIPGDVKDKDPTVTVKANSEACWLFVKVDVANNTVNGKDIYSFDVRTGDGNWTKLEDGVYYRVVDAATAEAGASYYVLSGDTTHANGLVRINQELTKADINAITTDPTLTFTAYAVQKDNVGSAADAWKIANP